MSRLSRITGTFDDLDKLTNIMYNLEHDIYGFKLQIHNIEKRDFENDIYEMIFSVPCKTYYRGLKEMENAIIAIDKHGAIRIVHKVKDSACHIEFDLKGNVNIYYKSSKDAYSTGGIAFMVDWSKRSEPMKKVKTLLYNNSGYIFKAYPLDTTMCNIANYYNADEKAKERILKNAWNIEIR